MRRVGKIFTNEIKSLVPIKKSRCTGCPAFQDSAYAKILPMRDSKKRNRTAARIGTFQKIPRHALRRDTPLEGGIKSVEIPLEKGETGCKSAGFLAEGFFESTITLSSYKK